MKLVVTKMYLYKLYIYIYIYIYIYNVLDGAQYRFTEAFHQIGVVICVL
jgi:hypothetical protein